FEAQLVDDKPTSQASKKAPQSKPPILFAIGRNYFHILPAGPGKFTVPQRKYPLLSIKSIQVDPEDDTNMRITVSSPTIQARIVHLTSLQSPFIVRGLCRSIDTLTCHHPEQVYTLDTPFAIAKFSPDKSNLKHGGFLQLLDAYCHALQ